MLHAISQPILRLPNPAPTRYLLDPFAFFAALIGAPLLVALLGFWMLFIPVIAVYAGGLPYLIIGTPLLLYYIPRHGAAPQDIALLALKTAALGVLLAAMIAVLTDPKMIHDASGFLVFLAAMSLLFALLWGHVFGWLYGKLERGFYKTARL